jgi:hypothetical protein
LHVVVHYLDFEIRKIFQLELEIYEFKLNVIC